VKLVDTHCHIDVAEFDADRDTVLAAARASGIETLVVPAIQAAGFDKLLSLCADDDGLLPGAGLHPQFMPRHQREDIERIAELATREQIVAIGECGLDYTGNNDDRMRQKELFEEQIRLSVQHRLPLLIHANRAVEDVVLQLQQNPKSFGIVHSFNGSAEQAQRLIAMDFRLGFGGAITRSGATRLHALVSQLPLDAIVLETDAPFQTGESHRGERNQPVWMIEVLEQVSALQQLPVEEVALQTTRNALALFEAQH